MSLQGIFDPMVKAYFRNKFQDGDAYADGYSDGYKAGAAEPPSQAVVLAEFGKIRPYNMANMFAGCASTSLDLSSFDTSAATDMRNMFSDSYRLTSLDLSGFDTSAAIHLNGMFSDCKELASLHFGIFDTSAVQNMSSMFSNCEKLTDLVLGDGSLITLDINFQWSPLSADSMKSVITHLKDYYGTDSAFAYTVTFSDTCWTNLDAEGATAPGGVTWRKYVENLGWNA